MNDLESWVSRTEHPGEGQLRPSVSLCYAQSLDGSLAAQPGESLSLSCPESLILTHQLRATHDAILVGIGTVLADDPSLTVRHAPGNHPQPIILDGRLRFPLESRMLVDNPHQPWIMTTPQAPPRRLKALEAIGARVFPIAADENGLVSLVEMLRKLAFLGIKRLMVEGGAQVLSAFLRQGLADRICITIAPCLVGGMNVLDRRKTGESYPELGEIQYERHGTDIVVFALLS